MAVFFLKYHKNCPSVRVLPLNPGLRYALVAPVCSARCPIEAFSKQTVLIFYQAPSLNEIQVAVSGATKAAKKA